MEELKRQLAGVDVFEPLPPPEARDLASTCGLRRLGAGEIMFIGSEAHGQRVILLLSGRARAWEDGPPDRTVTVSVAEGGTVVSVAGLAPRPRGLRVEALEPSLFCFVGREIFEGVVRRNPEVGLRFLRILGERIVVLEERLTDLAYKEVTARLASAILRLAEGEGVITPEGCKIPTRYTHRQLATMIGANREATTRALGRLRDRGAVAVRGRRIYVANSKALERAAEEE